MLYRPNPPRNCGHAPFPANVLDRREAARYSHGMVLTAIIRKEDEWFVAECPEIGTASQGKSVEEALANLKEATEVYLEEFPRKPGAHPILTTFEVAAHA